MQMLSVPIRQRDTQTGITRLHRHIISPT